MTSRQRAVRACRAAVRFALCAVTAMLVTLSGINPAAAAEPQQFEVSYRYNIGAVTGNSYSVTITGTVTLIAGHRYELEGSTNANCRNGAEGPTQKWGLAFGSDAENWQYLTGRCGNGDTFNVPFKATGPLAYGNRVYLQAGACGGLSPCTTNPLSWGWGWGTEQSVWAF